MLFTVSIWIAILKISSRCISIEYFILQLRVTCSRLNQNFWIRSIIWTRIYTYRRSNLPSRKYTGYVIGTVKAKEYERSLVSLWTRARFFELKDDLDFRWSSLSGQFASESARERYRIVWPKSAIGVYIRLFTNLPRNIQAKPSRLEKYESLERRKADRRFVTWERERVR